MFGSLLFLAVLGLQPAEDAKLEIVNARATYGALGSPIEKSMGRLPGDVAHFSFDIKNISFDKTGMAYYSFLIEIRDPKGQLMYKEGPRNAVAQNALGGNLLPCHAQLEVPIDAEPGVYSMQVTIEDRLTKKSVTMKSKGMVRKPAFGLVQVATFSDREGKMPSPQLGVVGESIYVHFAAVNFARDKKSGQPNLEVTLKVLDDKGNPVGAAPLTGKADKDIMEAFKLLPMQFGLSLNRVGQFTLELTATDHITSKTDTVRLPLRVLKNQ